MFLFSIQSKKSVFSILNGCNASGENANLAIILAMNIFVLALEGAFDTGLCALLDTFGTANELAQADGARRPPLTVSIIGVRKHVKTAQGLTVPVRKADAGVRPDVVLLPALGAKMPNTLDVALKRRDVGDAMQRLRDWATQGAIIGAACTGTFVLAESGLLDDHRATTTWWLEPYFRERFSRVELDASHMVVKSGKRITAGAALAHLDLALWVVRSQSPALAALTARYLVLDAHPSQAAFMIPDHLAHSDPLVERFEKWARGRLADGFSLPSAARATATSERTLARRLNAVLGKSPLAYFQDLRVERAVYLLQTSKASVDQVATLVGYADGVSLRSLLRKKIGKGIREVRPHS